MSITVCVHGRPVAMTCEKCAAESEEDNRSRVDVNRIITELEEEITRLRAEVAILQTWKQAIVDGLTVANVYHPLHETDAKTALNALVGWETMVALDPRVSADAAALIERGREEMRAAVEEQRNLREAALRLLDQKTSLLDDYTSAIHKQAEEISELRAQIAAHERECAGGETTIRVMREERWFRVGEYVRNMDNGKVCKIESLAIYEPDGTEVYVYVGRNGVTRVRAVSSMETDRFVLVHPDQW